MSHVSAVASVLCATCALNDFHVNVSSHIWLVIESTERVIHPALTHVT